MSKPGSLRSVRPAPGTRATAHALLAAALAACLTGPAAHAQDTSSAPILQLFEASWETVEQRSIDAFYAGYGGLWLPPPGRADSGNQSAGYDVFDRFDLGSPRNRTLYGTETGLKTAIKTAKTAGMSVFTDLVINHNGFRDLRTPGFAQAGGFPGFLLAVPGDLNGDFHPASATSVTEVRLSGLIDIAQEKNHQFIRHPVEAGNPDNIPAGITPVNGRIINAPDPNNARFFPDRDLGGTQVFDPRLNQTVTLFDFNSDNPLAGDAVKENATGLLMRHARWMIQDIGVDGFRVDAVKHMPPWVMDLMDQAVFNAIQQPNLDGSTRQPFMFSEVFDGDRAHIQEFIRKDINPDTPEVIGGNRDALDFPLFFAMRDNLTTNGLVNDWRSVKNASQDVQDDGLAHNGSQGVAFVRSHDDFGPDLDTLAHAFVLMRPGQVNLFLNAKEFGQGRDFPKQSRADTLGDGGDDILTLVGIRNSHGRGDFIDRTPAADQKELFIFEREGSLITVLNNRVDSGFDTRNIQTSFAPGTPLLELSGNADDPALDPGDQVPSVVVVGQGGRVDVTAIRNRGLDGAVHGKGFTIFGLATPVGELSLSNVADVMEGASPTSTAVRTQRLSDVDVIQADSFTVTLETEARVLPGGVRDRDADGDAALIKLNDGIDLNASGAVDFVTGGPESVTYGFESFTGINEPGFFEGDGIGRFEQTIDATALPEGNNFITVRAFRHRDDGGPAVFTDFKRAVYIDRLPPESLAESVAPVPGSPRTHELLVRSLDLTADTVAVFFNLPPDLSFDEVFGMIRSQNLAEQIDRDLFAARATDLASGNHSVTVLTFESTGTSNLQRFSGFALDTGIGAGVGDIDLDGQFTPADLTGSNDSFEAILFSRNTRFHPAADVDGNGRIDTFDLLGLGDVLVAAGAPAQTLDTLEAVRLRRGDIDGSGATDADDADALFALAGTDDWAADVDADGLVGFDDAVLLVERLMGQAYGDLDGDGSVSTGDLDTITANIGNPGGYALGDADGDGAVTAEDFALIAQRSGLAAGGLLGDLNGDGFIGAGDLDRLLGQWNQSVPAGVFTLGDLTGDGFVGAGDLDVLLAGWNRSVGDVADTASVVPEPGTLGLLGLALGALARRRARVAA